MSIKLYVIAVIGVMFGMGVIFEMGVMINKKISFFGN